MLIRRAFVNPEPTVMVSAPVPFVLIVLIPVAAAKAPRVTAVTALVPENVNVATLEMLVKAASRTVEVVSLMDKISTPSPPATVSLLVS